MINDVLSNHKEVKYKVKHIFKNSFIHERQRNTDFEHVWGFKKIFVSTSLAKDLEFNLYLHFTSKSLPKVFETILIKILFKEYFETKYKLIYNKYHQTTSQNKPNKINFTINYK